MRLAHSCHHVNPFLRRLTLAAAIALAPTCLAAQDDSQHSYVSRSEHADYETSPNLLNLDFDLENPCRNLVTNGSFESPRISDSYEQLDTVTGWRLSRGKQFELQRNVFGDGSAADGQQYLELAAKSAATVSQAVATSPGHLYSLEFSYAPRPGSADNRVHVRWDDQTVASLDASGQGRSQVEWRRQQVPVVGTGETISIEFADASIDDGAAGFIDDVRICRVEQIECDNLLTNGSFETPALNRSWDHMAQLPGWQLSRGSMFELQRGVFGAAAHGNQYLELASSAGIGARQSVATETDANYLLSFSYSPRPGNADNRVAVRWDGTLLATLATDGRGQQNVAWQHQHHRVRASDDTGTLEFEDASSSAAAAAGFIDDVRLCRLTPPKEEPKQELKVTGKYDLSYSCDRMGAIKPEVMLEIEGGLPPYECSGPAAGFPVTARAGKCHGIVPLGEHVFEVRDAKGSTARVEINATGVVRVVRESVIPPCCNCRNGEISVRAEGENAPFTMRWSDARQQTGPRATGLPSGTYRVTVTDDRGCRETLEVELPDGC